MFFLSFYPNIHCGNLKELARYDNDYAIVKSGNFGHQVNSDSDHVCFIFQLLEKRIN